MSIFFFGLFYLASFVLQCSALPASKTSLPVFSSVQENSKESNSPHITTITTLIGTYPTVTYYGNAQSDHPAEVICNIPPDFITSSRTFTSGSTQSTTTFTPYNPYNDPQYLCAGNYIVYEDVYFPYPATTTTSGIINHISFSTNSDGKVTEIVYAATTASGTKVVYTTSGIVDFTSTTKGSDGTATIIVNSGTTLTVISTITKEYPQYVYGGSTSPITSTSSLSATETITTQNVQHFTTTTLYATSTIHCADENCGIAQCGNIVSYSSFTRFTTGTVTFTVTDLGSDYRTLSYDGGIFCAGGSCVVIENIYYPYPKIVTTSGLIAYTSFVTGNDGSVTEVDIVPTVDPKTKVVYTTSGGFDFTTTKRGSDGLATIIVNAGTTSVITTTLTYYDRTYIPSTVPRTSVSSRTSTVSIITFTPMVTSSTLSKSSTSPRSSITSLPSIQNTFRTISLTTLNSRTTSLRTSSTTLSSIRPVTTAVAAQTSLSADDVSILQLALFLEYLEGTLYQAGVQRYSEQDFEVAGFARPFRDNIVMVAQQEKTHATVIRDTLIKAGVVPVQNCTFHFNFTSPQNFIGLGNMVSTAGVGAYLAGGGILKDNAYLLSVAASILTVEARHDAYIRGGLGVSPFPTSFDTLLPASWAYNIGQPFVFSCPQKLNYPIYSQLTLKSPVYKNNMPPKTPLKAGTNLTFAYDATKDNDPKSTSYIALLNSVSNVTYVQATSCGTGCVSILLPNGLSGGIAFAVLTHSYGVDLMSLTGSAVVAGPCEILIS